MIGQRLAAALVILGLAIGGGLMFAEIKDSGSSTQRALEALSLTVVSQTSSTVTLGYPAQPGFGYLYSTVASAGATPVLVSRTNDPSKTSIKFSKGSYAYEVAVIVKGNSGECVFSNGACNTPPPPPPPGTGTVSQTIVAGSTIPNITGWRGVYDANGDGVEDDPGKIEFYIDGVLVLSEINAPFGDTFAGGTPSASPGLHSFEVRAINDTNGVLLATNTVSATVAAAPPPPPPPPPGGCALPAFPDANCTGVPAGVTLTPSGSLTISTAGTVINGLDITGSVTVNAPNVTIRNTRIRSNAMWVVNNNSTGLLVEDSEILNRPVSGQPNCHNAIGDANFTARRLEIVGCENGADISGDNVLFVDNYVHDLDNLGPSYVHADGPHTDGLQISGGHNVVIRHNSIDPIGPGSGGTGGTSAIIMNVQIPNADTWIEDNYLDGRNSSYAVYAPRSQTHDIYINRNRMQRGVYGYTACVKLGVTVIEFTDNRDFGTNALIAPDNGVGGGCTN